jgi:hypothetical protein
MPAGRPPVITNRTFGFFAFILGLAGCSDTAMVPVSGSVKYKGSDLPAGVIFLDPDASIKDAPQGYALIKDGKFSTAESGGRPVKPGKYTVRIDGFDGKPGNELPLGKKLFSDHTETKEITPPAATIEFDIK